MLVRKYFNIEIFAIYGTCQIWLLLLSMRLTALRNGDSELLPSNLQHSNNIIIVYIYCTGEMISGRNIPDKEKCEVHVSFPVLGLMERHQMLSFCLEKVVNHLDRLK